MWLFDPQHDTDLFLIHATNPLFNIGPHCFVFLLSPPQLEVVILCGFPGCGKTSFYRRALQPLGHAHVNRDTLKTPAKCLAVARDALAAGRSVVVDNTNPSIEARAAYVRYDGAEITAAK